jgi:hypothetical protein
MSALVRKMHIAAGLQVLALGLLGCVEAPGQDNGLYYRPPVSKGQTSISTRLDPAEVAKALQDAGFSDVRLVGSDSVVLRSNDPRLVDCGTMIQVAEGNAAEFPANAPKSVLIEGFVTPGLIQRDMSSVSTVQLTRLPSGNGYAIGEQHTVTRHFVALQGPERSTASVTFDGTQGAAFSDRTSCQPTGFIARTLR